jgi:hypothetical protein
MLFHRLVTRRRSPKTSCESRLEADRRSDQSPQHEEEDRLPVRWGVIAIIGVAVGLAVGLVAGIASAAAAHGMLR